MANNSEINKLIIETVDGCCDDAAVKELIKASLQYELDIWNRNILNSVINDEYEQMVDKVIKKV